MRMKNSSSNDCRSLQYSCLVLVSELYESEILVEIEGGLINIINRTSVMLGIVLQK